MQLHSNKCIILKRISIICLKNMYTTFTLKDNYSKNLHIPDF